MLPISCLNSYEIIDYKELPFEQGLRHIKEYDELLTQIETLSSQLNGMLQELAKTCNKKLLEDYVRAEKKYEHYMDDFYESTVTEDADFDSEKAEELTELMESLSEQIKSELDKELYESANKIYEEIYFLKDDKFNSFDKYYLDDLW